MLSVAFRNFLDESTNVIMISVGKTSCFILLEMRDVNLLLLKTYVTGKRLSQPNFFPLPSSMIPIWALGALHASRVKEQKDKKTLKRSLKVF